MATPPPAGWYPDPAHPSSMRWWDGQNWGVTQQVQNPQTSVGFPGAQPPVTGPATGGPGAERQTWALALLPAVALLCIVIAGASADLAAVLVFRGGLFIWAAAGLVLGILHYQELRRLGWWTSPSWAWVVLNPMFYLLALALWRQRIMPRPPSAWPQFITSLTLNVFVVIAYVALLNEAS